MIMCCVAETLNLHLFPSLRIGALISIWFLRHRARRERFILSAGYRHRRRLKMFTENTECASPISITLPAPGPSVPLSLSLRFMWHILLIYNNSINSTHPIIINNDQRWCSERKTKKKKTKTILNETTVVEYLLTTCKCWHAGSFALAKPHAH